MRIAIDIISIVNIIVFIIISIVIIIVFIIISIVIIVFLIISIVIIIIIIISIVRELCDSAPAQRGAVRQTVKGNKGTSLVNKTTNKNVLVHTIQQTNQQT